MCVCVCVSRLLVYYFASDVPETNKQHWTVEDVDYVGGPRIYIYIYIVRVVLQTQSSILKIIHVYNHGVPRD